MAVGTHQYKVNGKLFSSVKEMAKFYKLSVNEMTIFVRARKTPDGYFIRKLVIVNQDSCLE